MFKDSKQKAKALAALALDKKAEETVILDVSAITSYTDCFVICSAQSTQQVRAISDHIEEQMKLKKIAPLGVEGRDFSHWVLMDYGDVVVHVFELETRAHYELERLWLDAPRIKVEH